MTVDIQELKDRYAATQDEDFRAVTRSDLTDGARQCYDEELARRDPKRLPWKRNVEPVWRRPTLRIRSRSPPSCSGG